MPSPFPGTDPWLERPNLFPNLHRTLINAVRAALNVGLPEGYVATATNRVWADDELRRDPDVRLFGPDGPLINGHAGDWAARSSAAGMVSVAAAKLSDPVRQPYPKILSDDGERLVTAVEILSPSDKKAGNGRISYLQKQGEFQSAGVSLVEIDLLRAGPHTTAVPVRAFGQFVGACAYHVCVSGWDHAAERHVHQVAPIQLGDRLPTLPVPLDAGVEPVSLDRAYDEGRFDKLAKSTARAIRP